MAYVAPNTVLALSTLSAATWNQDVVANVIDIESRLPTGAVQMYAGAAAPSNWLLCNGAEIAISAYPALYSVLSTTYGILTNGAGTNTAGTTHFRLPDMRGRVPIGAGTGNQLNTPTGSGAIYGGTSMTPRSVGAWGGEETHLLSISEMPSHSHGTNTGTQSADHSHTTGIDYRLAGGTGANYAFITDGSGTVVGPVPMTSGGVSANHTHAISSEGGGGRHAVVTPFVVLSYIIKT